MNGLPVSTRKSPSPVENALTLANAGTNATVGDTSASRPDRVIGWWASVDVSPCHRRSGRSRTSASSSGPGMLVQRRCNNIYAALVTLVDTGASADGRTARGQRTRAAVVDALLALLEEGDLRPPAPRIADRAGVSLRSVFQHFADRETLFAAVAAAQLERMRAV